MLSGYFNQEAELVLAARETDTLLPVRDRYGAIGYLLPEKIKCRCEVSTKEIVTPSGRMVRVERTYYLARKVRTGDKLDGKEVQYVEDWVSLSGKPAGWKAMV